MRRNITVKKTTDCTIFNKIDNVKMLTRQAVDTVVKCLGLGVMIHCSYTRIWQIKEIIIKAWLKFHIIRNISRISIICTTLNYSLLFHSLFYLFYIYSNFLPIYYFVILLFGVSKSCQYPFMHKCILIYKIYVHLSKHMPFLPIIDFRQHKEL